MLIPAASVCLFSRAEQLVLLGKRRCDPWNGYWACPGGKVEPGEADLAAAIRELFEETRVVLREPTPLWTMDVVVHWEERGFRVRNFGIEVPSRLPAEATDEIEPVWITFADAKTITPMGIGTRQVVDTLLGLAG